MFEILCVSALDFHSFPPFPADSTQFGFNVPLDPWSLSIYLSIYHLASKSIHLSSVYHLSITYLSSLSIHPPIYLSIIYLLPIISLSIYPSMYLSHSHLSISIHLSIFCLSIIFLSLYIAIYHLSITYHLCVYIHLSIYLSNSLSYICSYLSNICYLSIYPLLKLK